MSNVGPRSPGNYTANSASSRPPGGIASPHRKSLFVAGKGRAEQYGAGRMRQGRTVRGRNGWAGQAAGFGRAWQGRSRHGSKGHARQVRQGQATSDRAGHARPHQVRPRQVPAGPFQAQVRPGLIGPSQVRSCQVQSGPIRSHHVPSGQIWSDQVDQVGSGPIRLLQVRPGRLRSARTRTAAGTRVARTVGGIVGLFVQKEKQLTMIIIVMRNIGINQCVCVFKELRETRPQTPD